LTVMRSSSTSSVVILRISFFVLDFVFDTDEVELSSLDDDDESEDDDDASSSKSSFFVDAMVMERLYVAIRVETV